MNDKFQILEHTADLRIKVWGKDLPNLFKNAAEGMFFATTGTEPEKPTGTVRKIKVSGVDDESLLVNFLNELLYLSDIHNERFQIQKLNFTKDAKLEGQLKSYPLSTLDFEIKGVTYHELKIQKIGNIYEATIVFDI